MTRCRELLWKFTGPTIGIAAVYLYLWFAMDMPQLHHDQPRAFMLGTDFFDSCVRTYNIPELITGPVPQSPARFGAAICEPAKVFTCQP